MGSVGLIAPAVVLAACGLDAVPRQPPPAERYPDVVALFDHGIARTCSLNNGVCHNSNNYPDLHTVTNLIATLAGPCNVEVTDRGLVADACEPDADHLVIASAGIDARIVSAELAPEELALDVRDLTRVTLVLAAPPAGLAPGASDTVVRRADGSSFAIGEHGAEVTAVDGARVVLDLRSSYGEWSTKRFFDVRVYPPGPLRVHVGDPNGNGVEGAHAGPMRLITPGAPERSYLFQRLVDESLGELMPRQCRTWDDEANHALGCWIANLAPDGSNAYDPIDYEACELDVAGRGRCEPL